MAIENDFTVDQSGNYLVIRHVDGQSTVYTANQFYTWLAQWRDEPGAIVDYDPMTAETPTSYTMREGTFLDCWDGSELHKYLRGGAIATDKWNHGANACGVRELTLDAAAGLTTADKGKVVAGVTTGDTGRLLAYDVTNKKLWVQPDVLTDTFANASEAITVDGQACGNMTKASETGEYLWANPRTVGSFAGTPNPQVYIKQGALVIAEWNTLSNWDRGAIDILVMVTEHGTDIDSKQITAYARQSADEFAHYLATMTSAGQDVVVLNTAVDLQHTVADYYLFYDGGNGTDFSAGEIVTKDTDAAWQAEVVSMTEWVAGVGVLQLRGFKGTLADGQAFTGGTSGATGTTNGTLGDTYMTYDAQTVNFSTMGQVLTGSLSGAKRLLRGIQDDGNAGKINCQVQHDHTVVSGTARDAYYKGFVDNDVVSGASEGSCTLDAASTTAVSGFDDVTPVFVNGTVTHGGTTGQFVPGDRVTFTGGTARVLYDSGSALTLGNCTITALNGLVITGDMGGSCTASQNLQSTHTMNKNFQQQAANPYDVVVECGALYNAGRTMSQIYQYLKFVCQEDSTFQMYRVVSGTITPVNGEIYTNAYSGYAEKMKAPFGENPGGAIFGARGVWFEGFAAGQLANIAQVIDSDGDVNTPPTTITISVGGDCVADVQVIVARTSAGEIDKAMYASHATSNDIGDSTFEVQTAIAQDTPATGVMRVCDDSAETEHRFRYASWSGSIFTLLTEITAACEAGGDETHLNDVGIGGGNVKVGDCLRNVTSGKWAHIVSVSADQLITTPLSDGGTWATGNTYSIHTLPVDYEAADTVYVPFLDERATGTSVSVDVLYADVRTVTVRGRKAGLKSYIASGSVTNAGLSAGLIMPTDPNYNL